MNYKQLLQHANERLFIIAEAGVNHNGDVNTALRLVDAAVEAGCDAIKFQTWITEKVYSVSRSVKPEYQARTTDASESEFAIIKKLELSFSNFGTLKKYCEERGILFFSTPDEIESANFLASLGVSLMKTGSQDVTNLPFLRQISALGVPVIFSTGACTMTELAEGVEAISESTKEVFLLHCVSSYPAPIDQMNLSVIPTLKAAFGLPVGLSDHTTGAFVACAALPLGARIFEKHITLDKNMAGPDHQASLDPSEMREYCSTLRGVYRGIGTGIKQIMPCELDARNAFRRFVVAGNDIKAGSVLSVGDLEFKKVVDGIPPKYLDMLLGRKVRCDIKADTPIEWQMISND
ncbi:N-acetylneuraminate synthase family protein [Bradyrhizobium erythrophlei]|nr:N-acetylneuraminate synthase family protein [Bradyrhizobium erythrophlei]